MRAQPSASPVLVDGLIFTGFAGDEYVTGARGGYTILDQATIDDGGTDVNLGETAQAAISIPSRKRCGSRSR